MSVRFIPSFMFERMALTCSARACFALRSECALEDLMLPFEFVDSLFGEYSDGNSSRASRGLIDVGVKTEGNTLAVSELLVTSEFEVPVGEGCWLPSVSPDDSTLSAPGTASIFLSAQVH